MRSHRFCCTLAAFYVGCSPPTDDEAPFDSSAADAPDLYVTYVKHDGLWRHRVGESTEDTLLVPFSTGDVFTLEFVEATGEPHSYGTLDLSPRWWFSQGFQWGPGDQQVAVVFETKVNIPEIAIVQAADLLDGDLELKATYLGLGSTARWHEDGTRLLANSCEWLDGEYALPCESFGASITRTLVYDVANGQRTDLTKDNVSEVSDWIPGTDDRAFTSIRRPDAPNAEVDGILRRSVIDDDWPWTVLQDAGRLVSVAPDGTLYFSRGFDFFSLDLHDGTETPVDAVFSTARQWAPDGSAFATTNAEGMVVRSKDATLLDTVPIDFATLPSDIAYAGAWCQERCGE